MMVLVADRELRHEPANRIQDGVERVTIAGQDHPRRERPRTLLAERVEALVDDDPRIAFARASALDGFGDARGDRIGDRLGELALKARGRAEMMKQIGMGATDLRRDGLERDPLRSLLKQQLACRRKCGGTAFFGSEAGSSY